MSSLSDRPFAGFPASWEPPTPIPLAEFRIEVLAQYDPPLRSRKSWLATRQILDLVDQLRPGRVDDVRLHARPGRSFRQGRPDGPVAEHDARPAQPASGRAQLCGGKDVYPVLAIPAPEAMGVESRAGHEATPLPRRHRPRPQGRQGRDRAAAGPIGDRGTAARSGRPAGSTPSSRRSLTRACTWQYGSRSPTSTCPGG